MPNVLAMRDAHLDPFATASPSRRAVLVLGMHRSGTSAVTGALVAMGLAAGGDLLEPAEGVNDRGFFEHVALVGINEEILTRLDAKWHTPFAVAREALAPLAPLFDGLEERMRAFVAAEFMLAHPIVLKDPRLCLFWPVWARVLEEAGFSISVLVVDRHPAEVAASLLKRDRVPPTQAEALWIDHTLRALETTRRFPHAIVRYRDLLESPMPVFERAARALGLDLAIDADILRREIDPGLHHHQAPEASCHWPLAREIHERLARGQDPSEWLDAAVERAARERLAREPLLTEMARLFSDYSLASSKALEIGDLHTHAQAVVAERDAYIAVLHERLDDFDAAVEACRDVIERLRAMRPGRTSWMGKLGKPAAMLHGCVDRVEPKNEGGRSVVEVRGWALTRGGDPLVAVHACVGAAQTVALRFFEIRKDVQEVWPDAAGALVSGFSGVVPVDTADPREVAVEVTVELLSGRRERLGTKTLIRGA